MKLSHWTEAEHAAAIPEAEMAGLRVIRMALFRWVEADQCAREAKCLAEKHPADATLARCAAHLRAEVPMFGAIAARAVQAWAGDVPGPVFIRDWRGFDSVARADLGGEPRLSSVRSGEAGYPEAGAVFDLVAAELAIGRRFIAAVISDEAKRAKCLASYDAAQHEGFEAFLGQGGHTPVSLAEVCIALTIGY